jgi:hypothetical protein
LFGIVTAVLIGALVTERLVERPGTAFGRKLSLRLKRPAPVMSGAV